ncbi:PFC12 / paraflagellar component 12 [Leishmania donovani]|uniref:Uncharacterized protein n=2 Tax=Leishmania donovani TaxID=5661 RepID=A0A504XVT3_LEIDO|nr:hypothetical protein CGC20_17585 [Leishmania donovani]CAJ1987100.1 PFC12 / paraflagellar component 12 [Leishmania donovani]
MPVQTQAQRSPPATTTGASTGKKASVSVTSAQTVDAIAASMERFLVAQEAALVRMLDSCRSDASQALLRWGFSDAAAGSSANFALPPTDGTPTDGRQDTSPAYRASVISELLKQGKDSQQMLAVGKSAARETEELRRTAELEEYKLRLAQARNRLLRGRLAKLTRERHEQAQHVLVSHNQNSADIVGSKRAAASQIGPSPDDYDYTNDIVEARRQLDQCTKELEESQLRLHQLQQYHLGQLSGHLQPMMTANDALRTTENFLDPETNMAVRATVVDSLLEVNRALKPLSVQHDGLQSMEGVLPCLDNVATLWDRLAVQNFVVGRINRLFTCMCPTTPPLTLLKDTNMM